MCCFFESSDVVRETSITVGHKGFISQSGRVCLHEDRRHNSIKAAGNSHTTEKVWGEFKDALTDELCVLR